MAAPTKRKKKKRPSTQNGRPAGSTVRSGAPVQRQRATLGDWIAAARLRTLPLAIAPVVAGTGVAHLVDGKFHWVLALGCLAVAVCLQIGVNYANDYSDGIRGTDAHRVGPARLTGGGRARPRAVLTVALVFFALAAIAGIILVIRTQQWWMLLVGVAALAAAWFYTGGKRPYGYYGLGEVFAFLFFGLVATAGTTWIEVQSLPQEVWFAGSGVGLFAAAVLITNNLRDIEQDRLARKRTLSVLIGRRWSQTLFSLMLLGALLIALYVAIFYTIAWLSLLLAIPVGAAVLIVWTYVRPRELVTALTITSLTALAYAAVLAWAFIG